MEDISLHILDIAENSIRANAKEINIMIIEDRKNDLLTLSIEDDGEGMDDQMKEHALNPFFTTKTGKRIGLGLAFLSQSAEEAGGVMKIESEPGKGSTFTFVLPTIEEPVEATLILEIISYHLVYLYYVNTFKSRKIPWNIV